MIIGSPFSTKKFNKVAREGGETGIVLENGYVMHRATYGHSNMDFTYMGFPVYRIMKVTETGEKPVGLWAAPIRCVHEWYVLINETKNGLQDLIKEWRRLNPDS